MNGAVITIVLAFACFHSGHTLIQSRIVNGTKAEDVSFVAIIMASSNGELRYGGGTFISQNHVLSQGALVVGSDLWTIYDESSSVIQRVDEAHVHPEFDPVTLANDIGIFFISNQNNWQPVSLPVPSSLSPLINEQGVLHGFGAVSINPTRWPENIQRSHQRRIDSTECEHILNSTALVLNERTFCAIDRTHFSSPCIRDDGNGFIINIRGIETIVGVLSYFDGTCNPEIPSVFTRVEPYLNWINFVIGNNTL